MTKNRPSQIKKPNETNVPNKRQESERRERRMTTESFSVSGRLNLSVNDEILKGEYTYRWEKPENLTDRHKRDWDVVKRDGTVATDHRDNPGEEAYTRTVGTDQYGNPIKNVLICKYKDWHEADRQKLVYDKIAKTEQNMVEGSVNGETVEGSYFPNNETQALRITKAN